MSRFYPHTPYAEDQPLPYTILTSHVLARGFTSGAVVGSVITLNRVLLSPTYRLRFQQVARPHVETPYKSTAPLLRYSPWTAVLRSAGVGAVSGAALMSVALVARMNGKEEIEWSDRSWRLLENEGQVEADDWMSVSAVIGGLGGIFAKNGGWKAAIGGVGLGSVMGTAGYLLWRYGVNQGKTRAGRINK